MTPNNIDTAAKSAMYWDLDCKEKRLAMLTSLQSKNGTARMARNVSNGLKLTHRNNGSAVIAAQQVNGND